MGPGKPRIWAGPVADHHAVQLASRRRAASNDNAPPRCRYGPPTSRKDHSRFILPGCGSAAAHTRMAARRASNRIRQGPRLQVVMNDDERAPAWPLSRPSPEDRHAQRRSGRFAPQTDSAASQVSITRAHARARLPMQAWMRVEGGACLNLSTNCGGAYARPPRVAHGRCVSGCQFQFLIPAPSGPRARCSYCEAEGPAARAKGGPACAARALLEPAEKLIEGWASTAPACG